MAKPATKKESAKPQVTPEATEPIVLTDPVVEKKTILDATVEDMVTPAVTAPVEETPIVTVKTPTAKEINTADPNVSCIVLKKHSCTIGNTKYELSPGDIVLPNSVATILSQANVLIKR